VTGARIKIGYFCAVKLLRAGAIAVVTTRFPHDAAVRYAKEPDFEEWKDRLHIYGIDFRDLKSVQQFITHLYQSYPHLDILINNAAQTIRRPPAFYKHLMQNECSSLPANLSSVVKKIDQNSNEEVVPVLEDTTNSEGIFL
jgi:NAD(P)-dependent dehydrogenase (short-subunit alcohol dehydrogenase family)